MPKLTGIFDRFSNISQVKTDQVFRHIKNTPKVAYVDNFLGNRWLYPQTIPETAAEMMIDRAILTELVRLNISFFYNQTTKKVTIPVEVSSRFQPMVDLLAAMIDGLSLEGLNRVEIIEEDGRILTGSIWKPINVPLEAKVSLKIGQKTLSLVVGQLTIIPVAESAVSISFLGQNETQATGGQLGVVIDLRRKPI